jgi:hypothetical protein
MMHLAVAVMLLAVVIGGVVDKAFALDCNHRVISQGAPSWEVRELCGEPIDIQDTTILVTQRLYDPASRSHVQVTVPVTQSIWTYNFGPSRFIYFLTFQEGKLIDIKTGNYGH